MPALKKHLQKNLIKYSSHPNTYIQEQYSNIRMNLAELLRDINAIATTQEEETTLLLLSKVRLHTQQHDITSNGVLDNLIRNKLITNEMATSLMNDTVYAYNIHTKLCNMAEVLFVDRSGDLRAVEQDMHISHSDITQILEKKD